MTGQRVTRELLATLRAGDVVELRSTDGPELVLRGQLSAWRGSELGAEQLVMGDPATGLILSTQSLNPATWSFGMDLTVVSQVPRLYENSRRTEPAVGDIVRDREGDAWVVDTAGRWLCTEGDGSGIPTGRLSKLWAPLTLLWDGATGSLPAATS